MKRSIAGVLIIEDAVDSADVVKQVEQEVLACATDGKLLKENQVSLKALKKAKINQEDMMKVCDYAELKITDTGPVTSNIVL